MWLLPYVLGEVVRNFLGTSNLFNVDDWRIDQAFHLVGQPTLIDPLYADEDVEVRLALFSRLEDTEVWDYFITVPSLCTFDDLPPSVDQEPGAVRLRVAARWIDSQGDEDQRLTALALGNQLLLALSLAQRTPP